MKEIFEELFRAWCSSYSPEKIPQHLRADPVLAYGQYAFEEGFKLGMQLAAASLDPDAMRELI